eukprot:SAG31_NODE_1476_length_8195_cov_2.521863_4_plen_152_part_00
MALPAAGRSVRGHWAASILVERLPELVSATLVLPQNGTPEAAAMIVHVESVEDQQSLRAQVAAAGLVGFVADGSILPRLAGDSDLPMDAAAATPFASPASLRKSFELPNRGAARPVSGMAIPRGVTLIVGGVSLRNIPVMWRPIRTATVGS